MNQLSYLGGPTLYQTKVSIGGWDLEASCHELTLPWRARWEDDPWVQYMENIWKIYDRYMIIYDNICTSYRGWWSPYWCWHLQASQDGCQAPWAIPPYPCVEYKPYTIPNVRGISHEKDMFHAISPIESRFFGWIFYLHRSRKTHQHSEDFPRLGPEELIPVGVAVSMSLEGVVLWMKGYGHPTIDGEYFWWLYQSLQIDTNGG